MANQPVISATAKVTAKDVNGNNIAKQYNSVLAMNIDYTKGIVNIIDVTGSFYFPFVQMATLTYTITANPGGQHVVVMS